MKKNKLFAAVCALGASAMLVFSCITWSSVIFPEKVYTGDEFEISATADFDLTCAQKDAHLYIAVLLPKAWKASATYSTNGLVNIWSKPEKEIENEVMVNVSDTLKEAQSKKLMTEALTEKYGNLDNTEEVEWVVFKGQSVANIWGGDPNAQGGARPNDKFSVTAKITVEAGEKEMTFNSAVFVCQDEGLYAYTGFGQKDPNEEYLLSETKTVKVEAKPDYSSAVEVSPAGVSAGDYICITFDAAETPLKGAEVTLVATATLADGSTKTADAVKMEKQSGDKFFKYIYPKSLFGADNIKGIKVNFKAGETVVTSVDEEGFVVL